jgi:hypothetical protein
MTRSGAALGNRLGAARFHITGPSALRYPLSDPAKDTVTWLI